MRYLFLVFFTVLSLFVQAQTTKSILAQRWVDSVFNTLSDEEKIAQLMVVRLSTYDAKTRKAIFFDSLVNQLILKYNIGGICLFQGSPVQQATVINKLQKKARTPLMVCIDAEWGVGMRMYDSVLSLPHQMMLGAVQNEKIIYDYGKLVGEQCKRLGIHVNYAPVVDINNNPLNPVINDRSFGEDKYKVAAYGIQYMKGMQDVGVMACAKHFPGHGDVSVDSHYDLPIINKSMEALDSLELYPFKQIFNAGIGSAMIAHLYIPAIDNTKNVATSISPKNVTELLRNKLGYQGLTFTDALEMQGVKKYFPNGEAAAQSLIAGNDMLCLPDDVPQAIKKIKGAIKRGALTWAQIEMHCKKVLQAKYEYDMHTFSNIDLTNITTDVNKGIPEMKKRVAENAITLLKKSNLDFFPLEQNTKSSNSDIVYVGIGLSGDNAFAKQMRSNFNAAVIYFNYKQDEARVLSTVNLIKSKYKKVVIGIHGYSRTPAKNFGISTAAIDLVTQLQNETNAVTVVFGNPYAITNFCGSANLIACYEDDEFTQQVAVDLLKGKLLFKGRLPVTVCSEYKYGAGISTMPQLMPEANPDEVGLDVVKLNAIDSIATKAIIDKVTPGCVVLVAKNGKIAYHKGFGYYDYEPKQAIEKESVYDIASVTKILATTLSIMKLYEEGKIDLKKSVGDYLLWTKNSNKATLTIEDLLLHQSGLVPFIPFYKESLDGSGNLSKAIFSTTSNNEHSIPVASQLYMRKDWVDTMYARILTSPLSPSKSYVYSDNGFILLAKIIEQVGGMPIDKYVQSNFYQPLQLSTIGFNPLNYLPKENIVPSEQDNIFRNQKLQGDVNDPGAAMFGGVSGHAGLFSNATDMAILMQMLLNGGLYSGKRLLKKETVNLFTSYKSDISRRGLGFDKPEKDNDKRTEPYPCFSASSQTFGHTGFTGTCVWADPATQLIYIFLSNRTYPSNENKKLINQNIRPKIQEAIYQSLIK